MPASVTTLSRPIHSICVWHQRCRRQLINEFRFQWADELNSQFAQPPLPGQPTTANGFSPQVALTNGITFGKATSLDRVALPDERRFQFADSITYSTGNHTFKFGTDINHVRDIDDNLFTGAGSYTYSNINDFIVDYINFTTNGALRTAGRTCATQANPVANTRLAGNATPATTTRVLVSLVSS